MTTCGVDGLLLIILKHIMTYSLSRLLQSVLDKSVPQNDAPYIAAGRTIVSKSRHLVLGSWKCAWKHSLSDLASEACPLLRQALFASFIVNMGPMNVTPK